MDDTRYTVIFKELESFIDQEMATFQIPTVGIALVKDKEIIWQRGFGWQDSEKSIKASSDTVFRVGSISKLFTAVAIMQLHEQKKLNIDTPIVEYSPELTFKNNFKNKNPITLRHLLSHRAGILRESPIGNYFDDTQPSIKSTVLSIINSELIYEVGHKCKYSNLGPTIAGYILEKITGTSFPEYIEQCIFNPLKMESSSFLLNKQRVQKNLANAYMVDFDAQLFPAPVFEIGTIPAGNLYSTVHDLANFMICLFNKGLCDSGRIIEEQTLEEMFSPQFDSCKEPGEFGLGFAIGQYGKYKRFWHNGILYGFASDFFGLIEPRIGVITLNTVDSSVGFNEKIKFKTMDLLLSVIGEEDFPVQPILIDLDPAWVNEYEGKYKSDQADARVWYEKGDLFLNTMGVSKRISPISKDRFITNDRLNYGVNVNFRRDFNHNISSMKAGVITYKRLNNNTPVDTIPQEYIKFLGDYGKPHNILRIFMKDGQLNCLIEWFYEYPLKQLENLIFAFPKYGLYDGENIIFEENENGEITAAIAGFVRFNKI
jgi:CubicO group peptidase (beta-lactamase class C family)